MAEPIAKQHEATETSPLLSPTPEQGQTFQLPPRQRPTTRCSSRTILHLLFTVVLLASFGVQLQESPQTRINESIFCYTYYETVDPSKLLLARDEAGPGAIGGVDEMWCKADAIQDELAMLNGWQQLFDAIPTLLLAIPYGWVTDRFGRKPVLMMGLLTYAVKYGWIQFVTCFWQVLNIRLTWLSAVPWIFGGGAPVTAGVIYVVISDITPEPERAAAFLKVAAFNLLANLAMPPLAAWLMDFNPWIPALTGTALIVAAAVLYAFVPETLTFIHHHPPPTPNPPTNTTTPQADATAHPRPSFLQTQLHKLKTASSFLTADWRVPGLMFPFAAHNLVSNAGPLLLQYISKKHALSFSTATLLLTVKSAVVVLVLFFLLPWLNNALLTHRLRLQTTPAPLLLSRASELLFALGLLLLGIGPDLPSAAAGLVLLSLGAGAPYLLRSLVASLLPAHRIALAYSLLGLVETLAMILGAPLMAALFKRGLGLGGVWVGLPFDFLAVLAAAACVLLLWVGMKKGERGGGVAAEEEGE